MDKLNESNVVSFVLNVVDPTEGLFSVVLFRFGYCKHQTKQSQLQSLSKNGPENAKPFHLL